MATGKFVSYLRVSTQKQGKSGLGLEAQRTAVNEYLNGGRWRLAAECVEVESGKNSARPELAKALGLCRLHRATLVVAKLDRLARNVAFIANLMEGGVKFVAVDMPEANETMLHFMSVMAQHEARAISQRTKDALAAAKRRGVKLGGNPANLTLAVKRKAGRNSVAVRKRNAEKRRADLEPILAEIRAEGAMSLSQIASALNERGIPAPRGGIWHPMTVKLLQSAETG